MTDDSLNEGPTELDSKVALIVIDMQELVRTLPYSTPIGDVIANCGALTEAFRAAGQPVVLTRVAGGVMTRADRPMSASGKVDEAMFALLPELGASSEDVDIPKKHWGAFTDTICSGSCVNAVSLKSLSQVLRQDLASNQQHVRRVNSDSTS